LWWWRCVEKELKKEVDELNNEVESLKKELDESKVGSSQIFSVTQKIRSVELKMGELAQANNAVSVAVSRSTPWTPSSGARSGFGASKHWGEETRGGLSPILALH